MNIIKTSLAMLALTFAVYTSNAQIEVKIRPERPHYERPVAPSPRHVWIDEEWEPRNGAYVFVGGRWAEPPHRGEHWVPGHWKDTPHGTIWKPGHWR
jgi:YXWGXW repeat-containing protein